MAYSSIFFYPSNDFLIYSSVSQCTVTLLLPRGCQVSGNPNETKNSNVTPMSIKFINEVVGGFVRFTFVWLKMRNCQKNMNLSYFIWRTVLYKRKLLVLLLQSYPTAVNFCIWHRLLLELMMWEGRICVSSTPLLSCSCNFSIDMRHSSQLS